MEVFASSFLALLAKNEEKIVLAMDQDSNKKQSSQYLMVSIKIRKKSNSSELASTKNRRKHKLSKIIRSSFAQAFSVAS
ncbi:MAG: hypothetical protein LBJ32_02455 [Oscillospiraceae bacterium]|jgi:hypothetical protein|nr:hypothetical protein [Oscillospiraceae bacterium]